MKYFAYFLWAISFINVPLVAQESTSNVKLEFGLRDEAAFITSGKGALPFPINLHLTGGIRLFENYKMDFRIGAMLLASDFLGIDKGLFLQTNLFKSDYYFTLGIDFMNNSSEKGAEMSYWEYHPQTIFYCIGVGYKISKHFDFDLMYYVPKNNVYTYYIDKFNNHERTDKTESGGIVLGIQYSFYFNL